MATSFQGSGNGANGAGRGTSKADAAPLAERLPPQNIEAEQSLLGSILLDNEVLHDIIPFLRVEDFYRDAHQSIYAAIREMYDRNKGIDAVTLAEELTRRDQFAQIGGDETLALITGIVPHSANAQYYAEIVKEKATNRQLIENASEIIREGYSNQFTAQQLLESAESRIFGIAEDQIRGETMELSDIVKQAMDQIAHRAEFGGHAVTGIASGLSDLDEITGGFQPGQLIIVAARPSMGKTALALNVCDHAGVNNKIPSLFVSLEMGRIEIADRLLCARSRIDGHKLKTGQFMGMREMKHLSDALKELQSGAIFIDDTPARNMLQMAASARRLKRRHRLGLIILDYIQLVDSEDSRDSRQEQIAKISRRLKTLARDVHVPIIAISQLNRAVESREDKRPRMADLRESGAIEQDADLVLLLHRPDYYDASDQPGVAELIVAKNRNGATGSIKLTFTKNLTRFENFSSIAEPVIDDGGPF
jgi:replicative DNA helicase